MADTVKVPELTTPSGKKVADQFVVVRQRGILNAGMDALADQVLNTNPGMAVRWERYSPNSDSGMDNVTAREALGWRLASYADIKDKTPSMPKDGMIRRGDTVLMIAPKEVELAQLAQDAEAAAVDAQAPKAAFEDALATNKVRRDGGEIESAKPIGRIKTSTEFIQAPNHD